MAKSLAQIQAQIDKLQLQAASIKAKEIQGVIARIREAIEHYDLTAEDLGLAVKLRATKTAGKTASKAAAKKAGAKPGRKPKAATGKKAKTASVPKYRDEAGNSWTGVGKRPNWYKAALEAGKTAEDLLVKAEA